VESHAYLELVHARRRVGRAHGWQKGRGDAEWVGCLARDASEGRLVVSFSVLSVVVSRHLVALGCHGVNLMIIFFTRDNAKFEFLFELILWQEGDTMHGVSGW
jgi:hypothetical protein